MTLEKPGLMSYTYPTVLIMPIKQLHFISIKKTIIQGGLKKYFSKSRMLSNF